MGLVSEKLLSFALEATERTPFVLDDVTKQPIHIQLLSLCSDSRGAHWMGVSVYFDYRSLRKLGFDFSQLGDENFDSHNELMQDAAYMYVPLQRIQGFCYTISASRTDFLSRKKTGDLPQSINPKFIKFSRFRFDSRSLEFLGPRLVDPWQSDETPQLQTPRPLGLSPVPG